MYYVSMQHLKNNNVVVVAVDAVSIAIFSVYNAIVHNCVVSCVLYAVVFF